MLRSHTPELMDDPAFAAGLRSGFYLELAKLNRWLGNTRLILNRLQQQPPRTVIDIGCGEGALLADVRDTFRSWVFGVDLCAPKRNLYGVQVIAADATSTLLPICDAALCVLTAHHLTEEEVVLLVRNVGRSAKRFLIVDLVRHPLPLVLYSTFLWPFVSRVVMLDGQQSIRRAYTPDELRALVVRGLSGSSAIFEQWVSPIYAKQMIDIRFSD